MDDDLRGLFPADFEIPRGFATKLRIAHAIDWPIREVSVSDLCEKCGITRQAF